MSSLKTIAVSNAVLHDKQTGPLKLTISGGIIGNIEPINESEIAKQDSSFLNHTLIPGFIDVHIHGGAGADVMDGTEESLKKIAVYHRQHGTTGFLATTVTASTDKTKQIVEKIASFPSKWDRSAEVLGIHLEGPYLNSEKSGAQNTDYMKKPSETEFQNWLAAGKGKVKWITLAPELSGAGSVISLAAKNNIVAAAGHTNCTFDQFNQAAKVGLSHATHLFNGMIGIHHREPGAAGAALLNENVSVEIINDGIHVHPSLLKLITKLKGPDNTLLITDCMSASGMGDGSYLLGGLNVEVKNGIARIETGSLAGSTLTMLDAFKKAYLEQNYSLVDCVNMASLSPAKKLRIDHKKGKIAPGYDADFLIVNQSLDISASCVSGEFLLHNTKGDGNNDCKHNYL